MEIEPGRGMSADQVGMAVVRAAKRAAWPELERPREKLLKFGPGALSDTELLAIFLRTGTQGKTVMDLARELIRDFDGLRGLLEADQRQLMKVQGLGIAKCVQLKSILELSERYLQKGS